MFVEINVTVQMTADTEESIDGEKVEQAIAHAVGKAMDAVGVETNGVSVDVRCTEWE